MRSRRSLEVALSLQTLPPGANTESDRCCGTERVWLARLSYFYRTVLPDNLQAKAMIDLVLHFNWTQISILYVGDSYGKPGARELQNLAIYALLCMKK